MENGILYMVATPIGNLEDITLRALRTLKEVDLIAAEDTRETLKLLSNYSINKRIISYHEYNKINSNKYIIGQLSQGKSVALVCDRGTPGISDAGVVLVKNAIDNKIKVEVIPGPTALVTALVLSGFPTHGFIFEGFLPRKKGKLSKALKEMEGMERTIVIYESPYRVLATLKQMLEVWGDRQIAVCRELTKKFEEVVRGNISSAIEHFEKNQPKGEFTIVVEPLK
jgi:16S rRNA (cytidine1402-2'-O)-methyltransferase